MQQMNKVSCIEMKFIYDHLNKRGVKEQSEIKLFPFLGKQKKIKINRTCIGFATENIPANLKTLTTYKLGRMGKEQLFYEMKLIKTQNLSGQRENRFLMESKCEMPFCLNGNYVFRSYIEEGDKIEMGFNTLYFERSLCAHQENINLTVPQQKAAFSDLPIHLTGETGTGKTTLAKKIHNLTKPDKPFVHINLSSYSEKLIESELFGHVKGAFTGANSEKIGAFEQAREGTLFIDEIDSLPLELQTKLLIFLDEKKLRKVGGTRDHKVNCRMIFASGQKLQDLVVANKMRKDFYFRLASGMTIKLKSLRDNPIQIQQFCEDFELNNKVHIPQSLIEFYQTLPWPGNLRQLKSHLDKKCIVSASTKFLFDELDERLMEQSTDLFDINETLEKELTMNELKTNYVRGLLVKYKNNKSAVAKVLEISPRSVRAIAQSV